MVSLASPAGAMLPPPTPISRRPTLGSKRDSSFLDTDDETGLSSSTKKLKVAFSPTVDVRIVDDWDDKSFELVKEEVRSGIARHLAPGDQRDDGQYTKLLQLFSQDARSGEVPSAKLLKKYLIALDTRVSSLGECSQLVMAVVGFSWLGRDDSFAALYVKFLCSVATAYIKFVPTIMDKLLAHFAYLPASFGRLPEESPLPRTTMFDRVHVAIKTLLRQVPSATGLLARTMKFHFPNDLATARSYLQYQRHLLRVAEYAPELTAEVLSLLTQRLVSVDVQISQDIEELEEDDEEKLLQRPGSRDSRGDAQGSDDSDLDSVSESEVTVTEDEQRLRELRLKVHKLDGSLDLLFEYYTPLVQNGLRPDTNEAYQQLLTHFATFVLPSRTRHAQFLLFHFSQTSPEHSMLFAKQCLETVMQPGSVNRRLTACAYMSSFIARGAHIANDAVQDVFDILCEFLDNMRKQYEPNCRGPDRRSYGLYYAVAQAVLYIFCFRWRNLANGSASPEPGDEDLSEDDLLADGRELAWFAGVKETLHKNVYSILNPLKVCSPAIVGEFAKIAHHLRFMYVFPLLETNKRLRLSHTAAHYPPGGLAEIGRRETAWDRKTGEAHLQLEAYFPFDPYHLPTSKKWIENDYNEWKLPAGMRHEEDGEGHNESEEDDSDDEDDDDDDDDESEDESLPEDVVPLPA